MAVMLETPTTEPTRITAGDTVRWHKAISGYTPGDGWALEYLFACGKDVKTVAAAANADNTGFDIHITAGESANWPAGTWAWRARVKKDADVYTVAEGQCEVAPALAQGVDARTPARRALDEIKAYLADPNSIACQGYTIKGRSVTNYTLPELWQHHDRLVVEVRREEARRTGKGLGGRVYVRFGR